MKRVALVSILVLSSSVFAACKPAAPPPVPCEGPSDRIDTEAQAAFSAKCFKCHGTGGSEAADHDFSKPAVRLAQRKQIAAEVSAHDMPPKEEPRLTPDEERALLAWASCGTK